jgi:hypothetical protein
MGSFFAILGLGFLVLVSFGIGSGNNDTAKVFTVVFFVAAIALYFAPTYVANSRRHPSRTGITVLNVLLGWTGFGWIGALVWAYSGGDNTQADSPSAASAAKGWTSQGWTAERSAPPAPAASEKKCPFCAEMIKAEAVKCKHCGSNLTTSAALSDIQ